MYSRKNLLTTAARRLPVAVTTVLVVGAIVLALVTVVVADGLISAGLGHPFWAWALPLSWWVFVASVLATLLLGARVPVARTLSGATHPQRSPHVAAPILIMLSRCTAAGPTGFRRLTVYNEFKHENHLHPRHLDPAYQLL
jgi:uncharacterized integral membrane protein